jgi:hypothetical protein
MWVNKSYEFSKSTSRVSYIFLGYVASTVPTFLIQLATRDVATRVSFFFTTYYRWVGASTSRNLAANNTYKPGADSLEQEEPDVDLFVRQSTSPDDGVKLSGLLNKRAREGE